MKIKKFSEFITEGKWGSALKRSNSGKKEKMMKQIASKNLSIINQNQNLFI